MNNKWLFHGVNIFLATTLLALSICSQTTDSSDVKRFEVGGQFTLLRRSDANTVNEVFSLNGFGSRDYKSSKLNELGVGGRFTFNFTNNIAVEAEANFFREIKRPPDMIGVGIKIDQPGGRKFQAVFGPKFGVRREKFGIFGKVRPGFIRLDKYNVIHSVFNEPPFFSVLTGVESATFFNIDIGGVLEYYPSRRAVFRVDVGDTIIRYNAQKPKEINPTFTRHNLQINIGFGFRF